MHVHDVIQTCDPVVGMWLHITIKVCSELSNYLFVTDDGALKSSLSYPFLYTGILIFTLVNPRKHGAVLSYYIMIVSDWGDQSDPPYYTGSQQAVARQMGQVASAMKAHFTLSMCDNFYHHGVSDHDPRFKETFNHYHYGLH